MVTAGEVKALAANEDVKELFGIAERRRRNFRDSKHYGRRKRWLTYGGQGEHQTPQMNDL